MRITEISVTKLFGIFDHTIPLNLDDRITIIHSENGFGKTTLLKMLHGLFNEQYSELLNVPFQEFRVSFDDNSVLWVEKEDILHPSDLSADRDIGRTEQEERSRSSEVTVNLSKTDMPDPRSFSLNPPYDSRDHVMSRSFMNKVIDEDIPELEKTGLREWIHRPTGEILSLAAVLDRFYEAFEPYYPPRYHLPEWWIKLKELIEIHLIQTQRLQSISENEYAEELREIIQQKLADSASSSQWLDSTFPTRLVELMSYPDRPELTDDELQAGLAELDKKRSRLEDIGILDKDDEEVARVSLSSRDIIDKTKDPLTLYVQDMEEKLSVFDKIAEKIDLFKQMIDKRRFPHKEIVISKEVGFKFVTQDGETLPLTALSSGEQHELVLLYQLLFKTKPDSLILIDEPEISLHIAWQQEFVQDLQEITRLSPFDILIATHSPDIIHDRWDLTVSLEEPAVL